MRTLHLIRPCTAAPFRLVRDGSFHITEHVEYDLRARGTGAAERAANQSAPRERLLEQERGWRQPKARRYENPIWEQRETHAGGGETTARRMAARIRADTRVQWRASAPEPA